MNIGQHLIIMTLICGIALSGCSYVTVTTKAKNPADCTRHYTAPVVDTLITSVAAVPSLLLLALSTSGPTCCGGGNGGGRSETPPSDLVGLILLFGTASVVAGFSASHGYTEIYKCRTGEEVTLRSLPSSHRFNRR